MLSLPATAPAVEAFAEAAVVLDRATVQHSVVAAVAAWVVARW